MPANRRDPGLPLSYYLRDHPDASLLLICEACQRQTRVEIPAVIARLAARGVAAPAELGICTLADHVRTPCADCGARTFSTRPDWPLHRLPPDRATP